MENLNVNLRAALADLILIDLTASLIEKRQVDDMPACISDTLHRNV
jgi:hypothetical protein